MGLAILLGCVPVKGGSAYKAPAFRGLSSTCFRRKEGKMVPKAKEPFRTWLFGLRIPNSEGDRLGLDRDLLQAPVGQRLFGN